MTDSTKTVADYLPPGAAGSLVLRALAASVDKADELAPDRWGLSRRDRLLRLNLGMIEVMTVEPDEVRLLVAAECMPDHVPDADATKCQHRSGAFGSRDSRNQQRDSARAAATALRAQ
jgi:hypothetical protein